MFHLHRLALEDVVNVHQRAKVEEYNDHLFVVLRSLQDGKTLEQEQFSLFLGKGFVLTFQEKHGDCLNPIRDRLRKSLGSIRSSGSDFLLYAIVDAIIDSYFPIVDDIGETLEILDDQLSNNTVQNFFPKLHSLRGDLMQLRRAIRPARDALLKLSPESHSALTKDTQFYFRDCFDHTIQLIDLLDNYRELCSDLRDFYLSTINNRMNEIMKFLTVVGTIFMPLSFIASLYGMNFDTKKPGNMPELGWSYGYEFALAIMALVGCGMLYFVWRKGWLTSNSEPAKT